MNDRLILRLLWAVALVLLLLGLKMTLDNVKLLGESKAVFDRKIYELSELNEMTAKVGEYTGAFKAFERMPVKKPVSIDRFIAGDVAAYKIGDVRAGRSDVAGGWSAVTSELVLRDVPLNSVMTFIAAVENASKKPGSGTPWCMDKCVVRSSRKKAVVEAVLTFEALEK